MRCVWLLGLMACNARLANNPGELGTPDGDIDTDGTPPDTIAPLGPWSAPTPITDFPPVADDDPSATGDLLELYFNRANDIFVSKRSSVNDPWGAPTAVAELNTAGVETTPEVSYDGLTIFLASDR